MSRPTPWARRFFLFLLAALGSGSGAWAGPEATRVGETRVVFAAKGTVVRAEASDTGAPVGTLPKGTPVKVLEVALPWARVEGAPAGRPALSGWIRAYQAIEPAALAAPPPAPTLDASGARRVHPADVSAAGRQFDDATEKGYRRQRVNLERGYALVDEMERASAQVDSIEAIEFQVEGAVGRPGNDPGLPGRVPASPPPPDKDRSKIPAPIKKKAEELLGGLLGGKKGGEAAARGLVQFASGRWEARFDQLNAKFTPDQEYYLGRAVAANALARHGVEPNQALRRYVRQVGEAIVRAAHPTRVGPNYGGYHFEVLNSDEVNGVSGPGGFVLVTRGAVLACQTEDELAGILAHELAHVTLRHAEGVLRASKEHKGRMQEVGQVFAAAADADETPIGQALVKLFEGSVDQITRTGAEHAYGSRFEFDADREGSYILYDTWYDWWALRNLLARLPDDGHHRGDTHAPPQQRAAMLDPALAPLGAFQPREWLRPFRRERFDLAVGRTPPAPPPAALPPAAPPPAAPAGGFPPPQPAPGGTPR